MVPVGPDHAGEESDVLVSPSTGVGRAAQMTPEEYRAFIESIAGKWVGEFHEPADLPLEKRDDL